MPPSSRILIVGNDAIITHLVSAMLRKRGCTIAGIVETGEGALIKSAELVPDLVLVDTTPGGQMDGVDAAHYIYQLFHIPVVIITGLTDEGNLGRIKYAKPYGIVFKPFTAVQITTAVELALYLHADRARTLGNPPVGEPRKMMDNTTEAILLLDKPGRIIFLNTFATWFVDSSAQKTLMQNWRDVFRFINSETGEEIKDPVTDVAGHMSATIFDSNTTMLTTTQKRRKVLVTIRPIRDDHDQFLAVFLSLREDVKKVYM